MVAKWHNCYVSFNARERRLPAWSQFHLSFCIRFTKNCRIYVCAYAVENHRLPCQYSMLCRTEEWGRNGIELYLSRAFTWYYNPLSIWLYGTQKWVWMRSMHCTTKWRCTRASVVATSINLIAFTFINCVSKWLLLLLYISGHFSLLIFDIILGASKIKNFFNTKNNVYVEIGSGDGSSIVHIYSI